MQRLGTCEKNVWWLLPPWFGVQWSWREELGGFMKWFTRSIFIFVCLGISFVAAAGELDRETNLERKDIQRIKILGTDEDRIHLYVIDKNSRRYRLKDLSEEEATRFLDRVKSNRALTMRSLPDLDGVEDVMGWE